MSRSLHEDDFPAHRFAWDGFSFLVPEAWDLSFYDLAAKASAIRMEDAEAVRLQMEWWRPTRRVSDEFIRQRYDKMARQIAALAVETHAVEELPAGWVAYIYTMPDKRRLAICFWLAPGGRFFCFLRVHIDTAGFRYGQRAIRLMANSFRLHEHPTIPWEVYDMAFALDRRFALAATAFEAGRKMMAFEWRLRRFILWQFSLADLILKKRALNVWAADVLNKCKRIRGPVFIVQPDGKLGVKKRTRYPFGHYEEIGRWCFRYQIWLRHLPERNLIRLAVFNYRKPSDLALLDPRTFMQPQAP
jgi:hypothetical protein